MTALGDLVNDGKLREIGFSNVSGWQLARIASLAPGCGCPLPVAVQPQYSLLERGIEWELMPSALEAGISITPWSPLAGGWLTGKYVHDARPTGATRLGEDPNRGVEAYDLRNNERTHRIIAALRHVAERQDCPPEHVALAWVCQRPGVAAILLGARNASQLAENLGAAGKVLSESDMQVLTQVSAIGVPPYPYGFLQDWSGLDVWSKLGT